MPICIIIMMMMMMMMMMIINGIIVMTFTSLPPQVLPQPSSGDGSKVQVDSAKKKAFITVLVIQVDLQYVVCFYHQAFKLLLIYINQNNLIYC